MRREGREPLPDHAGESPLLSRSGEEKGLRGSGAGTLGKNCIISKIRLGVEISVRFAAAAKSLQSCQSLCDPIDGSPPGSPVPGILQARTLEWVAMSFSNA